MAKKKTNDSPMMWKEEDYQCRADLDAIARASAVQHDPKRMAAVKAMAKTMLDENKRRRDEAQKAIDLGQGLDSEE